MAGTPFDLLREKRHALGLPDPAADSRQTRETLLKGAAIGAAMVGLALGVAGLLLLRRVVVTSEIDSIDPVEADVERFNARLRAERERIAGVQAANQALAQGLLSVRSGSTLLRDLQLRVPRGVQLTEVKQQAEGNKALTIKGVAVGRLPFGLINALQLELKRSPLFDPDGISLRRASRSEAGNPQTGGGRDVTFELSVQLRPTINPQRERQLLEELGARGLAQRFALLQREGLLP